MLIIITNIIIAGGSMLMDDKTRVMGGYLCITYSCYLLILWWCLISKYLLLVFENCVNYWSACWSFQMHRIDENNLKPCDKTMQVKTTEWIVIIVCDCIE